MRCSYLYGVRGASQTQILYDANATATSTLLMVALSDFVVADVTVYRYAATFHDLIEPCLYAEYYDPTNPIVNTSVCLTLSGQFGPIGAQQASPNANAIRLSNGNRVHAIRIATQGGVSFEAGGKGYGYNCSIQSSTIYSLGNSVFMQYMLDNMTVYNNTIAAPYGSGIFSSSLFLSFSGAVQPWNNSNLPGHFHHNKITIAGWSCFYSRRSYLQIWEYNDCRNFSYLPTVAGGAGGYYNWNALGWHDFGRVVRNNYFYGPNQKCWYLDSFDSNHVVQNNVCVAGPSEVGCLVCCVFWLFLFHAELC
jgi:hypothetical protein